MKEKKMETNRVYYLQLWHSYSQVDDIAFWYSSSVLSPLVNE